MTPEEQAAKEFRLDQLLKAEEFLEEAVTKGVMTRRLYHKAQVALAHDYIVDHERPSKGTDALRRCSPSYFLEEQREDMAADPKYRDVVISLAQALVTQGFVDSVAMPAITQALGKA